MRVCLSELPTGLLRDLASRAAGYNAVSDDRRIVMAFVTNRCNEEIDARLNGKDFPELAPESITILRRQLMECSPVEFAQILFELEA